jgi:hypothetical protein
MGRNVIAMSATTLFVLALQACTSQAGPPTFEGRWTPRYGVLISQGTRDEISRLAGTDYLWLVGAGASLPFGMAPEGLPLQNLDGSPTHWPDVIVPADIQDGARLAVHKVRADQVVNEVVAELTVVHMTETPYNPPYGAANTQRTCENPCTLPGGGHDCSWCRGTPCTTGYTCAGVDLNQPFHATASTLVSDKCNVNYGACGGGNVHECWTGHWTVTCAWGG